MSSNSEISSQLKILARCGLIHEDDHNDGKAMLKIARNHIVTKDG